MNINPFSSTESDATKLEGYDPTEEEEENEGEDEEMVTLVARQVFNYTEHDVHARFANGESEYFTCDDIKEDETVEIVLYNYPDDATIENGCGYRAERRVDGAEVMTTLVIENLNFLDTTARRPKQIVNENVETLNISRPNAEDYVKREPDKYYIKEDEEESVDE